jgi:hypothetical protein
MGPRFVGKTQDLVALCSLAAGKTPLVMEAAMPLMKQPTLSG